MSAWHHLRLALLIAFLAVCMFVTEADKAGIW